MINVARQPVQWIVEIRPNEGETWPEVLESFGKRKLRPSVLVLTVSEDNLDSPSNYLKVREGRWVRKDGSDGARVGHYTEVFGGDLPVSILRKVRIALDTIRGEARNLGLIVAEESDAPKLPSVPVREGKLPMAGNPYPLI